MSNDIMLKRHTTRHRLNLLKAVLPIGFNISNVSQTHLQGGPKKQPSSKIFITQPKINIFISYFYGLQRRYFDTRSPNSIQK